jgi:hypothetical protein
MLSSLLVCSLLAISAPLSAAGATGEPLPRSDYAVRPACSAPAPGRASCLALGLEPKTTASRARVHPLATKTRPRTGLAKASECAVDYPSTCLTPENLQSVYFPGEQPDAPASEPQTIALVDAYNDLTAEADLNVYATEFGLPACTKANGCFKQVGESGSEASSSLPFPKTKAELEAFAKGTTQQREEAEEAEGWALETATDVEVAHAVCNNCQIVLVEAGVAEYSKLGVAENTAVALHATEISNSWGGPESGADSQAFNHAGIAITAAAGDDGYLNWDQYATREEEGSPYFDGADYPASSPHVISVGGTHLSLGPSGAWQSESAWNSEGAGGSGCSASLQAPEWQQHVSDWAQVGCGQHRANADISADADPATGVNVYDSTRYPYEEEGKKLSTVLHWAPIGGTSVASPIIASMVALAGGAHGVAYPAQTLYSHLGSSLLHDVTEGGNGECHDNYSSCGGSLTSPLDCGIGAWICNTTAGYDGPTGVGTPNGIDAFKPGEAPAKGVEEGEPKTKSSEEGKPEGGGSKGSEGSGKGSEVSGTESESTDTGSGNPGNEPEDSSNQPSNLSSSSGAPGGVDNAPSGPAGKSSSTSESTATQSVRVLALALTPNARAALHRGRLTIAQLALSFRLNRATTVRVTLAVRVRSGTRTHWRALTASLAFAAIKGANRHRLHGSSGLKAGTYRLTLTPSGGTARSLTIRVA